MSKVYDCFPFFNELEMLDLRLNLHAASVDYFVIIESTRTFTGRPKPLYFQNNKEAFAAHRDKIIHVIVDDMPESDNPFIREYHQRHALLKVAATAHDDDVFIVADADELLRQEAIEKARTFNGLSVFDMPMFQFYLNLRQSVSGWTACYATQKKHLTRIEHVAEARWVRHDYARSLEACQQLQIVRDAGWHFTHLGGVERLHTKFAAYSHSDDLWPRAMRDPDALRHHIVAGGIVGNFKEVATLIPITYPYYPLQVNNHQACYAAKGMIRDVYEAMHELQCLYRKQRNTFAKLNQDNPGAQELLSGLSAKDFSILADLGF